MTVKAILATKGSKVATIEPSATLAEAAKLLSELRIGAIIVTSVGDRVAGLLSERDIVRTLAAEGASALDKRVDQTMTRKVVTCGENDTLNMIMERMTAGRFRHMPVVESERLIGVISIGDVVKMRLEEMENEHNAMREYIATA
ncbi:hypoxic response protein 1 [Variibacter gotjawalensis]|uniref:Hypoxic response protein 1 n=1 Tax=Variibacter gotjawalensis TaxID=1333996 RepID=A0A0S3PW51_9BRAD|nr:CBS domain-containing protein [Variibacter gotjawalensis]NIK45987.1 CBS domain-containing protein [Variibacter gotjawalensis]RZS47905.1 CBS domain protein [Variibacter gotjawalensis]BAT60161.1 hypoxic response protein 1 [Variibacter gotjawalensis]